MPHKVEWYIENQIIFTRFWGETTLREVLEHGDELDAYFDQSDRPLVHLITDASQVTKGITLKDAAQLAKEGHLHPKSGWSIMVGQKDMLVKFATNVARQLFKMRQRTFDTNEEALAFLKEIDVTIDWSKADPRVVETMPESLIK